MVIKTRSTDGTGVTNKNALLTASELDNNFIELVQMISDKISVYTALANFPATGVSGQIYVDSTTNYLYRWSSTEYLQVGGGGSAPLTISDTAPTTPDVGEEWLDTETAKIFTWTGNEWVEFNEGDSLVMLSVDLGENSSYVVSETAPTKVAGLKWIDLNTGIEWTCISSNGTLHWVEH